MQEYDIMYSGDNSLKLTNYRIIQTRGASEVEILLKDYISTETIIKATGNYGRKTIACVLGLLLLILPFTVKGIVPEKWLAVLSDTPISLFCFIAVIFLAIGAITSFSLYLLGLRTYLRINGKYSTIVAQVSRIVRRRNKFIKRINEAHLEFIQVSN